MFSLGSWSTQVPTGFQVSRGTQERARSHRQFRLRDYHPLWSSFPAVFDYQLRSTLLHALQPLRSIHIHVVNINAPQVWAVPFSLALLGESH